MTSTKLVPCSAAATANSRGEAGRSLSQSGSHQTLTNFLLPNLKATPGARIVSTASDAHKAARLDFDDLQLKAVELLVGHPKIAEEFCGRDHTTAAACRFNRWREAAWVP